MKGLLEEIKDIPIKAQECFDKNQNIKLPQKVPYIGMGSSYFAPLTLFYAGSYINPQIASEYFYYLSHPTKPLGVLVSQSGESSETVWNINSFTRICSVTNNSNSTLSKAKNNNKSVLIYAGDETYSSTKTYTNTLITLYLGLGLKIKAGVKRLINQFEVYQQETKQKAKLISNYLQKFPVQGLYVVGSGPNIGTAHEAALTLSETTKLAWQAMAVAQYDHGPKETADNSVLLTLNANGRDQKRIEAVRSVVKKNSNALIVSLDETRLDENQSPITLITQANWLMNHLADELKVGNTFELGGKVTLVEEKVK